jgi:hypothetical protein
MPIEIRTDGTSRVLRLALDPGPGFDLIGLGRSPVVRQYLARQSRAERFTRWGHVLDNPDAYCLVINRSLDSNSAGQ